MAVADALSKSFCRCPRRVGSGTSRLETSAGSAANTGGAEAGGATAAAAASTVIKEAGLGASRAVQVAGYALAVASLLVCSFALWHLGRRLLNRLAHISHGNTALIQLVDGEAIYEISGSRSGKTHRVWVDLKLCSAACGCRVFLTEGVCGHADAALAAAKAAGLCVARRRAARRPPESLLSRAALRSRDALRDIADPSPCFEGLAAKSRSITDGSCFSGLRGRNRDPPPAIQDAQAAVPEGTPLKAVQAGRRNRSVAKKATEPEWGALRRSGASRPRFSDGRQHSLRAGLFI